MLALTTVCSTEPVTEIMRAMIYPIFIQVFAATFW